MMSMPTNPTFLFPILYTDSFLSVSFDTFRGKSYDVRSSTWKLKILHSICLNNYYISHTSEVVQPFPEKFQYDF